MMQHIHDRTSMIFKSNEQENHIITAFIEDVRKISDQANDLYTYCNGTGSDLYKISRAVDKVRGNLARQQANLSNHEWLSIFSTDHLILTWRLYNMIAGFEVLQLEQVNNFQSCKFGLWYYGNKDTRISNLNGFTEMGNLHKKLHSHAANCHHSHAKGDKNMALTHFDETMSVLMQLVDCIKKLQHLI